jgi:hypothetical protein
MKVILISFSLIMLQKKKLKLKGKSHWQFPICFHQKFISISVGTGGFGKGSNW